VLPSVRGQRRQRGARGPAGAEQGHGDPGAAMAPQAHWLVGNVPTVLLEQEQLHQPFYPETDSVPRQRGQR